MLDIALRAESARDFDATVAHVREALSREGFGVLTERVLATVR